MVTFYDDFTTLLGEYADKEYDYLVSRGISRSFALLRFNLEQSPSMNHVYDSINQRSYTVLTRFWTQQKLGGFGIWIQDHNPIEAH